MAIRDSPARPRSTWGSPGPERKALKGERKKKRTAELKACKNKQDHARGGTNLALIKKEPGKQTKEKTKGA